MDKKLDSKITAFLDKNQTAIFADIDRLLSIESVWSDPEPGAPCGAAVKEAIDTVLGICAAHGLKTRNIDGIIGEAVYGEGNESLGIITHMDVVPAGSGWTKPPYALTVRDGILYGRGVADDKGPAIAALWALLAALDAGAKINRKIVFLFGGDEERGMSCLRRYLETEKAPDIAFTPDADFPVIFCEKTICHGTLTAKVPAGSALMSLRGGTRTNVVPEEASALIAKKTTAVPPAGVSMERAEGGWLIKAKGAAAHASTPGKGDNAIIRLLGALSALLPQGDPAVGLLQGLHSLCAATDGSGFGIACSDGPSGPLTFNLGVISFVGAEIAAQFDIRHPVSFDADETLSQRMPAAAATKGYTVGDGSVSKGLHIEKEHPLIRTLMDVYNEVNGSHDEPLAIGGGTYARLLPCAVAYGILFHGDPETIHMPDECLPVESFMKATRIYANAIAELCK